MLTSSSAQQRLRTITEILLDPEASPGTVRDAAHDLTDLFAEQGGFDESLAERRDRLETYTAHGKAISPLNAARCTWEYQRTAKFLQGVHAALREAQARFPGQRIKVLYAGTGPYATLALPLMPFFSPEEVCFTLLDLHGHCLDSVRRLLETLGYTAFVADFVVCDAITYRHPPERPLHVIVTETMLRALEKEPQVAITLNLAPQLAPGGLLVPECIEIRACLADPRREVVVCNEAGEFHERLRVDLGQVFELNLATVPQLAADFPKVRIDIPEVRPVEVRDFLLLTRIVTFGTTVLGDYESSLNCPVVMRDLRDPAPGSRVEIQYRMDESPRFVCERLGV